MSDLVLYHAWASTCSQKVRFALAEKGLEWEGHLINLRQFEQLDDAFLALNPDGMVPVLIHDGFVVRESSVINVYLDEVFPDPPLIPPGPRERARVGMWSQFIDDVASPAIKKPSFAANLAGGLRAIDPARMEQMLARMPSAEFARRWRRTASGEMSADEIEVSEAELRRTLDRMTVALAEGPWLIGQTFTLADINMTPFVARIDTLANFDLAARWPLVDQWLQRVRSRPAFEAARFVEQKPETAAN